MMLALTIATEQDAPRIADIHMAAFGPNEMLQAQFPTPAVREGLKIAIVNKAIEDIRDPHTAVLLVQDTEHNHEIISFAKWSLPSSTTENETPWVWPEGTRLDILDQWSEKVEEAKKSVCDEACYRLSFIGTHPDQERRGAATMLIQWVIQKCCEEDYPAYLESTPVASALYHRLGFVPKGKISMSLDDNSVYEEVCYLRSQRTTAGT